MVSQNIFYLTIHEGLHRKQYFWGFQDVYTCKQKL